MSAEDVRDHVDRALETAVATGADLDDVETILEGAMQRVEELRVLRSGGER